MQTSFEVLFVLSMIVPPAAVVIGMAILFGRLLAGARGRVRHTAVAQSTRIALSQLNG